MEIQKSDLPVILIGLALIFVATNCKKEEDPNIVSDVDGNVYHTVVVGTQHWIVENLKVTHYNDGSPIPFVGNVTDWNNLTTGAYCVYDNDLDNGKVYGKLYNFYAVADPQGICPVGWHVTINTDWEELADFLGGESVAGGKLKESGTAHWLSQNSDATDEVGFTALPGGQRGLGSDQGYFDIGYVGNWWASVEDESFPNLADAWILLINDPGITNSIFNKSDGLSVRCVKDE